jgi:hypothetical protein
MNLYAILIVKVSLLPDEYYILLSSMGGTYIYFLENWICHMCTNSLPPNWKTLNTSNKHWLGISMAHCVELHCFIVGFN